MSMQTVEYQGYGIDLRRFHSSNPDFNNFLHEIIDDNDFYDVMMHSQDVVVATATNTDSFTFCSTSRPSSPWQQVPLKPTL